MTFYVPLSARRKGKVEKLTHSVTKMLAVLIVLLKITNGYQGSSSGCGSKAPVTPGKTTLQTIEINDPISGSITRAYNLRLPSDYDENKPYTFIIDFHGYYMDANSEEKDDNLSSISDSKGLIIVYPFGSNDSASNLYGCLFVYIFCCNYLYSK